MLIYQVNSSLFSNIPILKHNSHVLVKTQQYSHRLLLTNSKMSIIQHLITRSVIVIGTFNSKIVISYKWVLVIVLVL